MTRESSLFWCLGGRANCCQSDWLRLPSQSPAATFARDYSFSESISSTLDTEFAGTATRQFHALCPVAEYVLSNAASMFNLRRWWSITWSFIRSSCSYV